VRQLEATEKKYSTCLKEHNAIAAELERSNKEFKEFERKDIKYREDLKHAKTKVKKAEEKRSQAEAKLKAGAQQVCAHSLASRSPYVVGGATTRHCEHQHHQPWLGRLL
jgi:predicted  nucleic acid-binding Zn-ribbon protein